MSEEKLIAEKAVRAWYEYITASLSIVLILFFLVFFWNIEEIGCGEWWSAVFCSLYQFGGDWLRAEPWILLLASAIQHTIISKINYQHWRKQVSDSVFKYYKTKHQLEAKAQTSSTHIFGGNKTSAKQFFLVLLTGIVVACLFFMWLLNP